MRFLRAKGTRGSTRLEESVRRGWSGQSGSGKGTSGQIEDLSLSDREREVSDLVRGWVNRCVNVSGGILPLLG